MPIRKPGWPTSWPGSPSIRLRGFDDLLPWSWRPLGGAKSGGLIWAAIAHVFTIGYVANLLGEDKDWLCELSGDMFPEDGRLRVYGVGEDRLPAFTRDGIETLRQIIADERAAGRKPPSSEPTESSSLQRSPHRYCVRLTRISQRGRILRRASACR
jgi:hypothetical protein